MINRRTLLVGSGAMALGQLLTSCGLNQPLSLQLTLLEGALPPAVLRKFTQQVQGRVKFLTAGQMQSAFQRLQTLQQLSAEGSEGFSLRRLLPWAKDEEDPKAHLDNLVSLGDYWLELAIAQKLIEPLALSADSLAPLPEKWQRFVRRDRQGQLAEEGPLWAAPYKIQSLVVVYRQSQFAQDNPFSSWQGLLSSQLKRSIALPNHPRIVLGLVQKMQGNSFNAEFDSLAKSDASAIQLAEQLKQQLSAPFAQLSGQVRTYDSHTALKALVNEDLKAVVAWSGDVITALRRYSDLRAAVPAEGSLLSADMWVRPNGAVSDELTQRWISFCWKPEVATTLSTAGRGISPIFLQGEAATEPAPIPKVLENSLLTPDLLRNSEPLLPLPPAMQTAYQSLWQQLREG